MRSIAIASGKGGVGKTNITVNLGIALARMGKRVVVVDADIVMANLGLTLGIDRSPINIHNVLMGEVDVKDAVYEGPDGLKYVPAGLSMSQIKRIDYQRLKDAVDELASIADYVLVDNPSGLAQDSENALKSCREVLIVTTPEPTALADAIKIKNHADKNNINIAGVVFNMVTGDRDEIKVQDVETVLETKALAVIPLDPNVRKASSAQQPAIIKFPNSPFSQAMTQVALRLTGDTRAPPAPRKNALAELIKAIKRLLRIG